MKAAIFLSRQSMYPSGSIPWVRKTNDAIEWLYEKGYSLTSSLGSPTWDIITTIARNKGIPLTVVIPSDSEKKFNELKLFYQNQFSLSNATMFHPLIYSKYSPRELQQLRDSFIIDNADILLPISIRRNGTLFSQLASKLNTNYDFSTSYQTLKQNFKKFYSDTPISTDLQSYNEYLFHWTRSFHSPWPDENLLDFYTAVIASSSYPRTAYHTLKHILYVNKIYGSVRHMPVNTRCVAFTDAPISDFIHLMKWRSRYLEMSFEPYGIGIEKQYALNAGIKKVVYIEGRKKKTAPEDQWLYQSRGKTADWQPEREYRYKGDFSLSSIPKEKLIILCTRRDEAKCLQNKTDMKCISLFE